MLHRSYILVSFLLASASTSLTSLATPIEKRVTHSGQGTWFTPGGGNCGFWDTSSNHIVALSMNRYGSGGNCNQWVEIKYNGKTAYGKVRDSCEACGEYDLDMSPSLFSELASTSKGRIPISWHFMAQGWSP